MEEGCMKVVACIHSQGSYGLYDDGSYAHGQSRYGKKVVMARCLERHTIVGHEDRANGARRLDPLTKTIVMANVVMHCILMAYVVMSYVSMAHVVIAYLGKSLCGYGPYDDGPYDHGQSSYGRMSRTEHHRQLRGRAPTALVWATKLWPT